MAPTDLCRRYALPTISLVLAALAVLDLALHGGGGYDLVVRHEAGLLVWAVLATGIAAGILPLGRWTRTGQVLVGALAALTVWNAVSFTWTSSAERSTVELSRVVFLLGVVVLGLCIVNRRNRTALLAGLFTGASIVVLLALLSRLFPSAFPLDVVMVLTRHTDRISYPFGYWNAVGCLGAMVFTAGLAASAGASQLLPRALTLAAAAMAVPTMYVTYSRGTIGAVAVGVVAALAISRNRWVVGLHGIVLAASGTVVVLTVRGHEEIAKGTGTTGRGSVLVITIAAAVACALVATSTGALQLDRRLRLPRRQARVALAIGVLVVVVAGGVVGPHIVHRAWHSFEQRRETRGASDPAARLTNLSGQRVELWRSALRAFDAEPVHGIGPGTFEFWWGDDPTYSGYVRDAHSLYLETLGELGIVGLLLLLAAIGAAVFGGVKATWRQSMTASGSAATAGATVAFLAWAIFAFYDWMWESTTVTALALAGIAVSIARTPKIRPARPPSASAEDDTASLPSRKPVRLRLPVRIAAVLGCLVCLLALLPALSSTSQVRGSQDAAAAGDLELAISRANDAIASEPWAASPYLQRALVEERGQQLAAAAMDARRAADREPSNYQNWLILSRIQAERGHVRTALAAFRQATAAKPSIANALKATKG
jgi:hypothetical protein